MLENRIAIPFGFGRNRRIEELDPRAGYFKASALEVDSSGKGKIIDDVEISPCEKSKHFSTMKLDPNSIDFTNLLCLDTDHVL